MVVSARWPGAGGARWSASRPGSSEAVSMKTTLWRSRFFRSLRAGRALGIRHRGQVPLLGALLLAARVNDRAISIGDYQAVLRYARAAAGVSNTPADWQSPAGRAGLGVFQNQVMTYLIQSALLDDQIAKCGVAISAKDQSAAS